MEPIPARLLRPQAEECKSRPPATPRQVAAREYILEAAEKMFVKHGRARLTMTQFAYGIEMATATIRRHICDMHQLFRLVLATHLDRVMEAVSAVPRDTPNLFVARRAAYFEATRGLCGVPTPLHFLLMQDRFSLPEDQLEPLEFQRSMIGTLLSPGNIQATLNLLDSPHLDLARIEAMLGALEHFDGAAPPNQAPAERPPDPPRAIIPRLLPAEPIPTSWINPDMAALSDDDLKSQSKRAYAGKRWPLRQERKLGGDVPSPPNPPSLQQDQPDAAFP
jgi:AcrR family transcriptional regulator